MKYSGIGGQAVLEGVMMRNKDSYAVAVRKPDKEIEVKVEEFQSISTKHKLLGLPFLRGVVNFVESLYIGMKALSFSAELFEEDEKEKKIEKKETKEPYVTALVVTLSIAMAILVFMILPYGISLLFQKLTTSSIALTAIEGVIRFLILVMYMVGISIFPDIKRVYMYHGAEHKAINCIEEGLPLTVANVRRMTRKHLRCGTSFIINVIILSVILFMFIRVEHLILRLLFRILLIPVIAAVAYEFLRIAGTSRHPIVMILSIPGLWFQSLTTKEPEDAMIEVAIKSVEAVFDWQAFLEEESGDLKKKGKNQNVNPLSLEPSKSKKRGNKYYADSKKSVERIREKERSEERPKEVKQETEEEDEILNALDRFFMNQKKKESQKSEREN